MSSSRSLRYIFLGLLLVTTLLGGCSTSSDRASQDDAGIDASDPGMDSRVVPSSDAEGQRDGAVHPVDGTIPDRSVDSTTVHDASRRVDAHTAPDVGAQEDFISRLPDRQSNLSISLSEVGLYSNIATKALAADLIPFTPTYPLWSDGVQKRRWVRIPAGTQIDSSDMDHWQMPIGTMFFKEFALGGRRLETRLIARTGAGPRDYWMGTFVWAGDESDAILVHDAVPDVLGTTHDVPEPKACGTCHNGEPGRALGFSALQLSTSNEGTTVAALVQENRLSVQPEAVYVVPGDEQVRRTLGYIHANCGNCHNERGAAWPDTDLDLTLRVSDGTPEDTAIYRTSIGIELQYFNAAADILRVAPGQPDQSAMYLRMAQRGLETQMPPIASEVIHEAGLMDIRLWITNLDQSSP